MEYVRPKILSIVVPVYNEKSYLETIFRKMISQPLSRWA